jgi:hypothetical protein
MAINKPLRSDFGEAYFCYLLWVEDGARTHDP